MITESKVKNSFAWLAKHGLERGIAIKLLLVGFFLIYASLTFYNHPTADDFAYANETIARGFWQAQYDCYMVWSGRYFATFLIDAYAAVTHPLGLFFEAYWIVALSFLILTLLAIKQLIRSTLGKYLSPGEVFWSAMILFTIYTIHMPTTNEGFYWLSGAATYQIGLISSMLLFSLLIASAGFKNFSLLKKIVVSLTTIILAITTAGSNETIMAVTAAIIPAGCILTLRRKDGTWVIWFIALIATSAGTYAAIAAPGNWHRQEDVVVHHQFWYSLSCSIYHSFRYSISWGLLPGIFAAGLLTIPWAKKLRRRGFVLTGFGWNQFLLTAVFGFGIIALSLFPGFYSLNEMPPCRAVNTTYMLFIFLLFFLILASGQLVKKEYVSRIAISRHVKMIAQAVLLLGLFWHGRFLGQVSNVLFHAPVYDRQMTYRHNYIEQQVTQGNTDVVVEALQDPKPMTIFRGDWAERDGHMNQWYCDYFDANSITVEQTD